MTPAGDLSGFGTPSNSQSRRGSADNLVSMDAVTTIGVLPTALQNRLNSLGNAPANNVALTHSAATTSSREGIASAGARGVPVNDPSIDTTNASESRHDAGDVLSRRTSENDSEHSSPDSGPQHFEFSPEEMSKVPSYSTALRSHPQTPISEVPPTYQSATSQSLPRNPTVQSSGSSSRHGGRRSQR